MNYARFFTSSTVDALKHHPPGQWIPAMSPSCIRLQAGYPSPDLVPALAISESAAQLLEEEKDLPLQYLGSKYPGVLRGWVMDGLCKRGMSVQEDELIITAGSAQAIDLVARIFLDAASSVVVESPTYMESLETFQNFTDHILTVPVDDHGLQTEILERMLRERQSRKQGPIKFIYVIPTNQNPTGITLSLARRHHLLKLAETHDFLILEDDAYGELSFGNALPTLKALDEHGRVIHLGSLSKVIAPGLRIGWATASSKVIDAMAMLKKDLTHPLGEAIVGNYLKQIDWEAHVAHRVNQYQARCETMLEALAKHMPAGVRWKPPTGGYFVWLTLDQVQTDLLLQQALTAGVSFIAGKHFFVTSAEGQSYLRLSFSYADESMIEVGVKRLAQVLRQHWYR